MSLLEDMNKDETDASDEDSPFKSADSRQLNLVCDGDKQRTITTGITSDYSMITFVNKHNIMLAIAESITLDYIVITILSNKPYKICWTRSIIITRSRGIFKDVIYNLIIM